MGLFSYTAWAAPVILVSSVAVAQPAMQHPAQVQVQQNMDAVLKVMRHPTLSEQQKIKQVEQYANQYLDYQRIAAFAVGLPWKQFTPKQKTEFISAFKDMIIAMYARSALMGAQDAQVKLLPKMVNSGKNHVDVFTEIQAKSGKKYEVAYQLYQSGNTYKVFNIRVDGASLVSVYRNQFDELIKQKGVDGMIATVRAKGLQKP